MKFYSEETKKMYDSVKELESAEKALKIEQLKEEAKKKEEEARQKKLAADRDRRRNEVTKAYDDAYEAYKHAIKLGQEYTKDYGEFTYRKKDYDTDWIDGVYQLLKNW